MYMKQNKIKKKPIQNIIKPLTSQKANAALTSFTTSSIWIAFMTIITEANWLMISNVTFSIETTASVTWIFTFLLNACAI